VLTASIDSDGLQYKAAIHQLANILNCNTYAIVIYTTDGQTIW